MSRMTIRSMSGASERKASSWLNRSVRPVMLGSMPVPLISLPISSTIRTSIWGSFKRGISSLAKVWRAASRSKNFSVGMTSKAAMSSLDSGPWRQKRRRLLCLRRPWRPVPGWGQRNHSLVHERPRPLCASRSRCRSSSRALIRGYILKCVCGLILLNKMMPSAS